MKISRKLIWLNLVSLIIFIFILLEVLFKGFFINWDVFINSLIKSSCVFMINFSKVVGVIFDTKVLLGVLLLIAIYFWFKNSKKDSVFVFILGLVSAGVIYILKELFSRARPLSDLVSETGFAFPSGHATMAVVFFGLLTYLIIRKNKNVCVKLISFISCVLIVLIIGFTRLYLGVHWFSDVIGGFAIGFFILSCGILLRDFFPPKSL